MQTLLISDLKIWSVLNISASLVVIFVSPPPSLSVWMIVEVEPLVLWKRRSKTATYSKIRTQLHRKFSYGSNNFPSYRDNDKKSSEHRELATHTLLSALSIFKDSIITTTTKV